MNDQTHLLRLTLLSVGMNILFMLVKILTGIWGHSYALIADGIESAADIFTSGITWIGLHLSLRPPDTRHPFGHGKIESLAGMFAGLSLLSAAGVIAWNASVEIRVPHEPPAWYTLPVLIGVVLAKGWLYRFLRRQNPGNRSRAIEGEAGHQLSDAVTSGAAAIGITIALIGGDSYAVADELAAIFACGIIVLTGIRVFSKSVHDILDGRVDEALVTRLTGIGEEIQGVTAIEKCLPRKSGTGYFVELHIEVDPEISVRDGHAIAHEVKAHLLSSDPSLLDVTIHVEPAEDLREFV